MCRTWLSIHSPKYKQAAQISQGAVDHRAAGRLDRVARAHLVGDRADATDARSDVRRLAEGTAAQQRLEETGWFVDPQLDVAHPPVVDDHMHRPLALHPGEGFDPEDAFLGTVGHLELSSAVRRALSSRNGAASVLNVRSIRTRSRRRDTQARKLL